MHGPKFGHYAGSENFPELKMYLVCQLMQAEAKLSSCSEPSATPTAAPSHRALIVMINQSLLCSFMSP